jgi:alpha-1,3-mannosyl-glycoprotein beta-1,2-N-acetylglucosaminyltransferase
VCRTYNFGERGSSKGQFYYDYLRPIKLNDVDVDWNRVVRSSWDSYTPSRPAP